MRYRGAGNVIYHGTAIEQLDDGSYVVLDPNGEDVFRVQPFDIVQDEFTKTEALRRIRALASQARGRDFNIKPWFRLEVGLRTHPVALPLFPADLNDAFPDDDDLADFADPKWASSLTEVKRHGAVVHLYFTDASSEGTAWGGELYDVLTGWMGTPDAEPRLVVA